MTDALHVCPDCADTHVVENTPAGDIPCPTCDWRRLRKVVQSRDEQLSARAREIATLHIERETLRVRLATCEAQVTRLLQVQAEAS